MELASVKKRRQRARFGKEKTSQARISKRKRKRKRKKVREGGDGRRIKIKNTTLASFLSILSFWARLVFFTFRLVPFSSLKTVPFMEDNDS